MPIESDNQALGAVAPASQFNVRSVSNGFVVTVNFREEVYDSLDKVVERLKSNFEVA